MTTTTNGAPRHGRQPIRLGSFDPPRPGAPFVALVPFLLLSLTACALDYEKEGSTPADQVPQMVFENLKQTGMKDGRRLYTMESLTSEVYQAKKEMRLNRFRFQEYDSEDLAASTGEAEGAIINLDSNDARITGRLKVRSEEQMLTLEVVGGQDSGLTWAQEDRILKTDTGVSVRLTKDDGSATQARSMTLDLGSNRLELEEGIQGTWTPDKNNANPSPPPTAPVTNPPLP